MELINMQIIVFTLEEKFYAIRTDRVEEISKTMDFTIVPNAPDWVQGLINLRGNVVTMVNLSKLLLLQEDMCYNNIIIIHNNEEKIGLMVKNVVGVMDIEADELQRLTNKGSNSISGIVRRDEKIINIVDIDNLLFKNEG